MAASSRWGNAAFENYFFRSLLEVQVVNLF
jgi:hypothetical protein